MYEKVALLGSLGSLGGIAGKLKEALKWDPALTSTLLGAGLGTAAAGPDRRIRGAMLGGGAGLAGGLAGAGLKRGLSIQGKPRNWVMELFGKNPEMHQHMLGGLAGLSAGAFIQPTPVPIIMNKKLTGGDSGIEGLINRAKAQVRASKPEVERV